MKKDDEDQWRGYFHQKVLQHLVKDKLEWKKISSHPFLPVQVVMKHPHLPWDWFLCSRLSFDHVQSLLSLFPYKEWDWHHLSLTCPPLFIQDNPAFPWQYEKISRRKHSFEELHASLEYALTHHQLPWNWSTLSRHPQMSLDHVFQHPTLPWDMEHVLKNCPFSSHHLVQLRTTKQNYQWLSQNPHNTLHILRKHYQKPWNWADLAQNIAFAPHCIYPYKSELPLWRWDLSLRNPRLTWDFYQRIRKETYICHQFHHLLRNHFQYSNSFFIYFTLVLRRFFLHLVFRRRLFRKLRVLLALKQTMDPPLLSIVLFQYVG